MDHKQAPKVKAAKASARRRSTHNRTIDSEARWEADWQAFDDANGVPGDALGDKRNIIWVIVNDRQLVVFDALDTMVSQAHNPPSSIQVGYGTYAQAYGAIDRARATRTTGPVLTSYQDTPSTRLSNPGNPAPGGLPHRSVPPTQSLPSSLRMNAPDTNTNAPLSYQYTPPDMEGLRAPLGSSATPPIAPPMAHPSLPPSTGGVRTPPGSSTIPPMVPYVMAPPAPHSASTSCNARIRDFGVSDENAYWVVLRGPRPGVYHGKTEARLALPTGNVGIDKCYSLSDADRSFVSYYMNGGFSAT